MSGQKNRVLSYDVIRIVAVAMVVLLHASSIFVADYTPPSADFMWGNILNSFSRVGVPLFIMLSGALMLNEHKQMNTNYVVKHIIGIVIPLIAWSLIYAVGLYLLLPIAKHEPVSVKIFLSKCIMGHYHLWFLYMIIGLYLITPILRLFVKEINKKYVLYFLLLSLVFQFSVPLLNFTLNQAMGLKDDYETFVNQFNMGFVGPYLAYYLLGWYISNNQLTRKTRHIIYILGVVGLFITIIGTNLFTTEKNRAYIIFYDNESVNIFLYAAAFYIFLYTHFQNKKIHCTRLNKIVTEVSRLSFGVYAVHIVVLICINKIFFKGSPGYTIPLLFAVVLIISYVITIIVSKIPVLKKIVKY